MDEQASAETVELVTAAGGQMAALAPVDLASAEGARAYARRSRGLAKASPAASGTKERRPVTPLTPGLRPATTGRVNHFRSREGCKVPQLRTRDGDPTGHVRHFCWLCMRRDHFP